MWGDSRPEPSGPNVEKARQSNLRLGKYAQVRGRISPEILHRKFSPPSEGHVGRALRYLRRHPNLKYGLTAAGVFGGAVAARRAFDALHERGHAR